MPDSQPEAYPASSQALPPAPASSRLIADGDSVARNAFRIGLRTDTPIPTAGTTQELDPNDILEVQDMAAAIARAEMMVAAPRSSRPSDLAREAPATTPSLADMFEALGHRAEPRARRATDDAIGPATPAPPPGIPTPVPPRFLTMPSASAIAAAPPSTPAAAVEEDAYYHPAGRIRSLADATLDGYRPEPTLLVRAAGRRKRFSWLFVAALLPLLVLAAIAVFAHADSGSASAVPSSEASRVAPAVPANAKTPLATTSALSKAPTVAPVTGVANAAAAITGPAALSAPTPVFDVNSLPSASRP